MAKKDVNQAIDEFLENIIEDDIQSIVGERFGRYSKYIIQDRAIPDVRDGLKPVQRRILYAMFKLKMFSDTPYKKSARIVGEVIGKYHPHGDTSVYEAMIRLSQTWKNGVTLIDVHGNNGSIDGDGPAAMRYTEARLSKNAEYLLQDIDKKTIPFVPNFDDEEVEPVVLPAKFPNLLVNGAMGIASGYATNIPTHNIGEVIDVCIYLLDHDEIDYDTLSEMLPGPDFPTGGLIVGKSSLKDALMNGLGSIVVRGKTTIEEMNKDGQSRIVIEEIPFGVEKSKIVVQIDTLKNEGKLPDIIEVRDESDRSGLRIAVDLKKNANYNAILQYIFKNTDLQVNFKYNMVAIKDLKPKCMGVPDIVKAYLNHQKDVITNRTNFLLDKASKRLHIVKGLIKMVSIIEEVVDTIRKSTNKANSKENLQAKFGFSELQAEAIVTMQLYRLSNTDVLALQQEEVELEKNIEIYNKILNSEKELIKVIKQELLEAKKNLAVPRKTQIIEDEGPVNYDVEDIIAEETVRISLTKEGYIKRSSLASVKQAKINGIKENDFEVFNQEVSTLDKLLIFLNSGNYIYLPVYKINETKWRDYGTFLNNYVSINGTERPVACFNINDFSAPKNILIATKNGLIKQVQLEDFEVSRYSKAIRAMKLQNNDEVVSCDITDQVLEIVVVTKNTEALRFRASDVSVVGTLAGGVKAISLKPTDTLVSAFYTNKNSDIVLITNKDFIKRMKVTDLVLSRRSRSGNYLIKRVKSNPQYLLKAQNMTNNQYKENVKLTLVGEIISTTIDTFSIKYSQADSGIKIEETKDIGSIKNFFISDSKKHDVIDPSYLDENKDPNNLFECEVPSSSKENKEDSVLDSLIDILASNVNNNETDIIEKKEEKKPIKIIKQSLFDDFDE